MTTAKSPTKTESDKKAENDKKAAEGREEKKKYWARKEKVYDFERTNLTRVVAFQSTSPGWWKIGGHSALFYYHRLVPRLLKRKSVKLRADTDHYHRFTDGVVIIASIDTLKAEMKELKMPLKRNSDGILSFALDKPITEDTLEALKNIESERMSKINQIVMPHDTCPEIYKAITEMQREIYSVTRKMQSYERDMFGRELMLMFREMLECYVRMTHETGLAKEMLKSIANKAAVATFILQELAELDLIESKRALRLAQNLLKIKQKALAEARKIEKSGSAN